ncbi:hypothetical protein EZV62_018602 [Acer yangbiense]|uniref:Retrotransposon Copia-like N-terminal domain-containing protein n=1 Tax=Acer yangbiense TaxID=1000413 RepID=A0A5C7HKE5_9ROSI|nr:hypothetical protein EZV62_018602 [Acer yangbiense]
MSGEISTSSLNTSQNHVILNPSSISLNPDLISNNAAAQLPLKLTSQNYLSWHAQFYTLLYGYDLIRYLDSSFPCPLATIHQNNQKVPNPDYRSWKRQDSLLIHVVLALVSKQIVSLVVTATTTHEAWNCLTCLYANKSHSRIKHLKERLSITSKGTKMVAEYMQTFKGIVDELSIIGAALPNDDLTIHVLNGLGFDYKENVVVVRAKE